MKRGNRLFAMLLAIAMMFTYMPAMAFAEDAESDETKAPEIEQEESVDVPVADEVNTSEEVLSEEAEAPEEEILSTANAEEGEIPPSGWHADDVESIEFFPAGNDDRFVFYEQPDGNYPLYFDEGDKITAHLIDGSEKNLTFSYTRYGACWWIEEDNETLADSFVDDNGETHYITPFMYNPNEWKIGENSIILLFGSQVVSFTASVLESPVTAISYEPIGSASEIKDRFSIPLGMECYSFPFADGDKITVTINGQNKEYVCEEGDFFDADGALPTKYGQLKVEGLEAETVSSWEAGNDYNVYLTYAGQKTAAIKVHAIEDPITRVQFLPKRNNYSEAEMRMYEMDYEGSISYWLDFERGDKIIVDWADGTTTEYVYNDPDDVRYGFFDGTGKRIPYEEYLSNGVESVNDYDDHISTGVHSFYITYLNHNVEYQMTITESSDQEVALAEYKISALDELDNKYEEIDLDAYREAQQDELSDIYDKAYDAINNATSIDAIDAAMATYDEEVAAVKTAEEMDDEDDDDDALVYQAEYHGTPFFEVGPYGEATLLPEEDETDITDYITVTTTDGEKMDCYFIHDYTDEDNPLKLYDENDNEVGFYAYVENSTAYIELWQPVDTDDIEWEATIEFKNANIDNEVESIVFKPSTIKLFSEDIKRTINGNTYYALRNRAVHSHLDETWRSRFALGDQLIVNYDNGRSKTFTNVDYYDDDSYEWNDGFFNSTRTESILVEMSVDSDTAMIDDELKSGNNKVKVYYHGCSVEINVQVETPESRAEAARIAEEVRRAEIARQNEQARQGTFIGGLPKVKISKPKAAKKSVTVKWKKLNKKQLKKGVTNIEVWVCPNGAFGPNDTIMKTAGKKKASLKVKGLAKGTYFVKVRAIKNVGGVKYYSAWSKVKKVKIKK